MLGYFLLLSAPGYSSAVWALQCQNIDIPVGASAENIELPSNLDIPTLLSGALFNDNASGPVTALVSGDYTIGARYCTPDTPSEARATTLQVLVHGATYTRNYWSGLADPGTLAGQDAYSWVTYAADQGYPTLSVDRLCNGDSSRPFSSTHCQTPLNAETIHLVIDAARTGALPGVDVAFEKIIFAGHSGGSILGNALSIQHPEDVDAYLLTGYSLQPGAASILTLPEFEPAAVVSPTQFGSEDPGYIQATSKEGTLSLFYSGDFDPGRAEYDFDHLQTVCVSEFATISLGQLSAPEYKGAVFVLNGNEDAIFCSGSPADVVLEAAGSCADGFSSGVGAAYPAARAFAFHNVPDTGHSLNLHHSAQQSFKAAHDFLAKQGL